MPHFIVEYTDNLKAEGDIPGLLRKANQVLIAQGGVFKPGAVRSRAIELKDYCMADGAADGPGAGTDALAGPAAPAAPGPRG